MGARYTFKLYIAIYQHKIGTHIANMAPASLESGCLIPTTAPDVVVIEQPHQAPRRVSARTSNINSPPLASTPIIPSSIVPARTRSQPTTTPATKKKIVTLEDDEHEVLAVVSEVRGSQPGEDKALIVFDAADGNLPVGMIETENLSCEKLRKEYQKANLESNPDSNLIHALHDLAEYESQLRLAGVVSCIHKHSSSNAYLDVQITPAESDVPTDNGYMCVKTLTEAQRSMVLSLSGCPYTASILNDKASKAAIKTWSFVFNEPREQFIKVDVSA